MDQRGGTETIVDVDHSYIGAATVQHGKQSGHSAKADTISDACGYGNDRATHHTGNHTGKRPLHAGYDDQHRCLLQLAAIVQKAMDAGNAHVDQFFNPVIEHEGREDSFAGAALVLDHLGEPDRPFTVISGDAGDGRYVTLDLLRELHAQCR